MEIDVGLKSFGLSVVVGDEVKELNEVRFKVHKARLLLQSKKVRVVFDVDEKKVAVGQNDVWVIVGRLKSVETGGLVEHISNFITSRSWDIEAETEHGWSVEAHADSVVRVPGDVYVFELGFVKLTSSKQWEMDK